MEPYQKSSLDKYKMRYNLPIETLYKATTKSQFGESFETDSVEALAVILSVKFITSKRGDIVWQVGKYR